MKLSEAMRKGAEQYPQTFGPYFEWAEFKIVACCALGAVWIGAGLPEAVPFDKARSEMLTEAYPELLYQVNEHRRVIDEIITRNDEWEQPRKEIADWLESIGL